MRSHLRWLLLILLMAALLRLAMLGSKSLWFDEAFSAVHASKSLEEIVAPGWQNPDPHPPLYYIALHFWIQLFGNSETAVRLPSALLSLGSVGLLYLLGRRLFNPVIGLMAAGLLAVAPLNVWYAQEARMYAAVTFLGLLAALWLTWDRWPSLLPLALTLTVGLYVDYTFVPLWVALSAVWSVWWWRKGRAIRPLLIWLLATGTAILLYLPWRGEFLRFLSSFNNFHILERLQAQVGFPLLSPTQILLLLVGLGIGLVAATAVAQRLLLHPTLQRWLIVLLLIGFTLATAIFVLPRFYTLKRFLLLGWPYVTLGVAWGLAQLGTWRARLWAGLLGLSLIAALIVLLLTPKDDWRGVVVYVNANVPAGDVIWIDPPWNRVAYGYYAPRLQANSGDAEVQSETAVTDVWLIAERFLGQTPPTSNAERIFDQNLELVETIPFYRLELRRYRTRETP